MSFSYNLAAFLVLGVERILMTHRTAITSLILVFFVRFPLPLYEGFSSTSFLRFKRKHLQTWFAHSPY